MLFAYVTSSRVEVKQKNIVLLCKSKIFSLYKQAESYKALPLENNVYVMFHFLTWYTSHSVISLPFACNICQTHGLAPSAVSIILFISPISCIFFVPVDCRSVLLCLS